MRIIAGDIGGTKSWLAWGELRDHSAINITFEHIYESADFYNVEVLLQEFIKDAEQITHPPDIVCLALPGPVHFGQPVKLTNLNWTLTPDSIRSLLKAKQVVFLNDFQAAAEGVSTLLPDDYIVLHQQAPVEGGTRVITGAGTGLGLAWMQADTAGRYHTYATEGGHIDFAPANTQQERLLAFARQEFKHVSWERVLSGPGVNQVYRFCLQDMTGEIPDNLRQRNGAVINTAAEAGDAVAQAAMQLFADIYASWLGNMALLYQPRGGLYIGGGISTRIQPWLQTERFLEAYFNKGRMTHLVKQMPLILITNARLGLAGALQTTLHHTKS